MSPRLSLVVSTIGRVPELVRLARSVADSPVAGRVQLVVVDQSADRRALRALEHVDPQVTWTGTTSGRGVSLGRNTGLRLSDGDVVAFPNDNTWYPEEILPEVLARFDAEAGLQGLSARLLTADGRPAMLRWPARPALVDRDNFYRTVVSPGLFLRRTLVADLGGFDEAIGTGAIGPAQAGEESDLVLRALVGGARIRYEPDLVVRNDEPRDTAGSVFVTKMAGYGTGQGRLWRRHDLPVHRLAWIVARKLVAAPVRAGRGNLTLARADLAYARSCLRGYLLDGAR
jgi:Glycosyl transferase family 2